MVVYHRPDTDDRGLGAPRQPAISPCSAGGTDVYPAKAARAGWGDMAHKRCARHISALAGLARHRRGGGLAGGLARLTTVDRSDRGRAAAPLRRADQLARARDRRRADPESRHALVGNICTASPAGDGAPNLLALDADVELESRPAARAFCTLAAFIDGYRHTACRDDEIVTAILVPKRASWARSHFRKLGARAYLVISIVMVAGVVETDAPGQSLRACSLAVGACSAVPQRLSALEAALARPCRWLRLARVLPHRAPQRTFADR